jgi:hypothetical protein
VNADSTTWLLAAPLFNKFTPLEEGELRTAINQLALQVRVTLPLPLSALVVLSPSAKVVSRLWWCVTEPLSADQPVRRGRLHALEPQQCTFPKA